MFFRRTLIFRRTLFSRRTLAALLVLLLGATSCTQGEPTDPAELVTRLMEDADLDQGTATCISDELFALAGRAEPEGEVAFDIAVHGFDLEGDVGRAGSIAEMEEKVAGITELIRTTAASCSG